MLTEKAWETLERDGVLFTASHLIDADYERCYSWMTEQLEKRVGPAPDSVRFPLWVWVQFESALKPRPDLRQSAHGKRGEKAVLIELKVDLSAVLQSDFDRWHCVINDSYLPLSEADDSQYEALIKTLGQDAIAEEKRTSWERIFDLEYHDEYVCGPRDQKRIQGVMWSFSMKDVRKVQHFTVR